MRLRVLKIGCCRYNRIGKISPDRDVFPSFNRIIVKAGVPDKRGRLERLPAAVLPTHYCNERQRVAMATRRETHTWGVAARSPFFSSAPHLYHSFHLERLSGSPFPSHTYLSPFSLPLSLSSSLSPPDLERPFFAGFPRTLRPPSATSRKRHGFTRCSTEYLKWGAFVRTRP